MVKSLHLFDRLKQKSGYSKFMKDNPDAVLYAIFCILSVNEKEGDKIQFDFFIPRLKKIAYSEYPFDEIKVQREPAEFEAKEINLKDIKIDIEDLWQTLRNIQQQNNDHSKIDKIIGILRKDLWELICISQDLSVIKLKINFIT